ncbi:MAG: type II glyceraldehyde-3-phosphate dehydrogenase, partial [Dehalococcoidia bacterium]
LYLVFQVHNEAITIPENIDAIRALTGIETEGTMSIQKTDKAMGVVKTFMPKTIPEAAAHAAIGEALKAERAEFRDEGYKGAEEPF